jgi:hypothetical protein
MNDDVSKITSKVNLSAMQPQLHVPCTAFGVTEDAPIIKEIKAKAMEAGITYVTCSTNMELPGKLLFDSARDPYIKKLAHELDQQRGVVDSTGVYTSATNKVNAKAAYDNALSEVRTKFLTILEDSGINELVSELQKGQASGQNRTANLRNRDMHPSLITVADNPSTKRTR